MRVLPGFQCSYLPLPDLPLLIAGTRMIVPPVVTVAVDTAEPPLPWPEDELETATPV